MLFFIIILMDYGKMCSFCLGSKTASTSSKQRGCPPPAEDFCGNTRQGGAKSNRKKQNKKETKLAREINVCNVKLN